MRYHSTVMPTAPQNADSEWLVGLRAIAAYMGVSERSIRRWRDRHGMPVGVLPSGHALASKYSIRDWVMVRGRMALDQRRNECPSIMTGNNVHGCPTAAT